jgi:hypothetical protein
MDFRALLVAVLGPLWDPLWAHLAPLRASIWASKIQNATRIPPVKRPTPPLGLSVPAGSYRFLQALGLSVPLCLSVPLGCLVVRFIGSCRPLGLSALLGLLAYCSRWLQYRKRYEHSAIESPHSAILSITYGSNMLRAFRLAYRLLGPIYFVADDVWNQF